jgi:hypothetical protein
MDISDNKDASEVIILEPEPVSTHREEPGVPDHHLASPHLLAEARAKVDTGTDATNLLERPLICSLIEDLHSTDTQLAAPPSPPTASVIDTPVSIPRAGKDERSSEEDKSVKYLKRKLSRDLDCEDSMYCKSLKILESPNYADPPNCTPEPELTTEEEDLSSPRQPSPEAKLRPLVVRLERVDVNKHLTSTNEQQEQQLPSVSKQSIISTIFKQKTGLRLGSDKESDHLVHIDRELSDQSDGDIEILDMPAAAAGTEEGSTGLTETTTPQILEGKHNFF